MKTMPELVRRISFVFATLVAVTACDGGPTDQQGTDASPLSQGDCPEIYAPVCGEDGIGYDNDCFANAAGVAWLCEGECPCEDDVVDELPGDDGAPDISDDADGCPEIFHPVCGDDEQTYDNECFANEAGAAIACDGACPCASPCEEEDVVDELAGEDADGCPEIWAPVCGADSEEYDNDCFANQAGATIECEGTCPCDGSCPETWYDDGECDLCLGDDSDCSYCPTEWYGDGICDLCFSDDPDCA